MGVPGARRRGTRSLSAIPGLAGPTLAARPHNPTPSPVHRARRAGRSGFVRPSSPSPPTSADTSAETPTGCRRPHPGPATSRRRRRRAGPPPHFPSRRGPGAARAVAPAPRKETGAPTHRGASLALPRVPMATATLQEPPHPARRDRLGGVRRIATTPCRAPPPRPPLPGRPTAANPQAQTLCERAPSSSSLRARAHTHARSNHLTSADVIAEEMCGAVQLFPENCPHYSVVPGGLRLPPISPFTPGGCFSRPEAEVGSGAGRAGRLQVPSTSPNQRQERGWEPGETGFTWWLSGQRPLPRPHLPEFQSSFPKTPRPLAGLSGIYQSVELGVG